MGQCEVYVTADMTGPRCGQRSLRSSRAWGYGVSLLEDRVRGVCVFCGKGKRCAFTTGHLQVPCAVVCVPEMNKHVCVEMHGLAWRPKHPRDWTLASLDFLSVS